ncbi:DUF262 domain-containing HNH endonuclease family protein [archaeon]|nr:DUF262 domain-containing HNH endonuclease family protein [archaeon]
MSYSKISIKEVVNEIDRNYYLPHIQRSMVWNEEQIYKLYDSLLRGYPIGTFLFWKVKKEYDISKIKFITDFTKNKQSETSTDNSKDEYYLVLDGQQRLQSFLIGLKGSYNGKELYLNVLCENKEIYTDEELIYESKFIKSKEDVIFENNILWVKVKNFALLNSDKLFDYVEELKENYNDKLLGSQLKLLEKNIKKLNFICGNDDIINYYLEKEDNYDKVLDIFIRTNSGGTKLSKADLLFSIIKLRWSNEDAYTEFKDLLNTINNDSFNFNHDFILKTCLVLIEKDVKYSVNNFGIQNISLIENNWLKIKDSIITTIDLLKNFGINSKRMLTSNNAIIPIIYFTFKNNFKSYTSLDKNNLLNTKKIKKWLLTILITNIFSGQTDELLKRFRDVIKNNSSLEFPLDDLNNSLPSGKSISLNFNDFSKINYRDTKHFLLLSLLYPDFNFSSNNKYSIPHVDHIFPKSLLKNKFSDSLINNIGNLQILSSNDNETKNNIKFEEWINTRDETYLNKNYLPLNKELYKIENFEQFIEERTKILHSEFNKIINSDNL